MKESTNAVTFTLSLHKRWRTNLLRFLASTLSSYNRFRSLCSNQPSDVCSGSMTVKSNDVTTSVTISQGLHTPGRRFHTCSTPKATDSTHVLINIQSLTRETLVLPSCFQIIPSIHSMISPARSNDVHDSTPQRRGSPLCRLTARAAWMQIQYVLLPRSLPPIHPL